MPGPQQPLYGMGRRLLDFIPSAPIATTVRAGIAIFSYCGNVTFGVTGDFTASPGLDVLAHGIEHGITELAKAARCRDRSAAAKRRNKGPVIGADGPFAGDVRP